MQIQFNVTGPKRKELVKLIADFTGFEANYCGAPTFAYEVGSYSIDKNGTVTADPNAEAETLEHMTQMLYENGFSGSWEGDTEAEKATALCAPTEAAKANVGETGGLTVAMPASTFTPEVLANLKAILQAKGRLIGKALGLKKLPIKEADGQVSFPWFKRTLDAEEIKAYTHLISALCEMARNQKRITAKEKETDNEKYAFRCFLLRLGFIGAEFKAERKILLRNLTGSSAFKGGAKDVVSA